MTRGQTVGVGRAFRTLWGAGTVGGLTDEALLARFLDRPGDGAEAAFEALVGRHGSMVLRVGRDVLGDRHRAQDVFQATFLILSRKAGSIDRPEALGSWLHGVALRVARKARSEAARRTRHEQAAADRSPRSTEIPDSSADLACALHEEVARLSDGVRSAVVLCYFQGLTYEEAASNLGVTEATVRGRLARARSTLRRRLARRGGSGLALGPMLSMTNPCSDRLIALTARSVWRALMGQESTPAAVAGLANGVSRTMFIAPIKAAAVLVALLFAAEAGDFARPDGTDDPTSPQVPRIGPVVEIARPEDPEPARLELTLEAALDRLIREDPAITPARFEIPKARAEVLTAGFRANPVYYADSILIPYGLYRRARPGGQTQYDVNISIPLDVSRKRRDRLASATAARLVIEAQYQDAVRLRVDRLASAFVATLEARDLLKLRQESHDRLAGLAKSNPAFEPGESRRLGDATKTAALARDKASRSQVRALVALASLLNIAGAEVDRLEVVGELGESLAALSRDALEAKALTDRPDLAAMRLAAGQMEPALSTTDLKSLVMWTLGDAASTAGVQRRVLNISQSKMQRTRLEQSVIEEIQKGSDTLDQARGQTRTAEMRATDARKLADLASAQHREGERDLLEVLASLGQSDEAGRVLIEARANRRRAQLALNTAIGRRVFP